MGAHLIYIGHTCRPNGRPWGQNVGPCYKEAHSNYKAKIPVILYGDKSMFIHDPQHGKRELPCMRISLIQSNIIKTWIPPPFPSYKFATGLSQKNSDLYEFWAFEVDSNTKYTLNNNLWMHNLGFYVGWYIKTNTVFVKTSHWHVTSFSKTDSISNLVECQL